MLKVGSIEKIDDEWIIHREYFRQGWVFKDEDAYRNHKDAPCYVAELSDCVYTADDFLELCKGQQDFADELFDSVDWQHPETLFDDWFHNGEWVECCCGKLVDCGGTLSGTVHCPFCGEEIEV